jgi:ribosomal protein S18 acetylase RimI-like enzyme
MRIRLAQPADHPRLAAITLRAYGVLDHPPSEDYAARLTDMEQRARDSELLVAEDGDGRLLGCVSYVAHLASPMAEHDGPDDASFRMLAVDPAAQGAGAGSALIEACIGAARRDGRRRLQLFSADGMEVAQRIYGRFGFRRVPESDRIVEDNLRLCRYELDL